MLASANGRLNARWNSGPDHRFQFVTFGTASFTNSTAETHTKFAHGDTYQRGERLASRGGFGARGSGTALTQGVLGVFGTGHEVHAVLKVCCKQVETAKLVDHARNNRLMVERVEVLQHRGRIYFLLHLGVAISVVGGVTRRHSASRHDRSATTK